MKQTILSLLIFICTPFLFAQEWSDKKITEYWRSGKTLPLEVYEQCPKNPLKLNGDKGYNVLIDVAHQCDFATMWHLPTRLHKLGYRSQASHASLNVVLDPNGKSRMRLFYDSKNKIYPFGWTPNLRYNVVITDQSRPDVQKYTDVEIQALKQFVNDGGSLVIMTNSTDAEKIETWSINKLLKEFGTGIKSKVKHSGKMYATLTTDDKWEVVREENQQAIEIRRDFGKGRILVVGNTSAFDNIDKDKKSPKNAIVDTYVASSLKWLCEKQKPIGGYFPKRIAGGGNIYPELEKEINGIVVYYAANQKKELLKAVFEEFAKVTKHVYEWYPSELPEEPMYLVFCSGSGGGWAVNVFTPKENGIINLKPEGLVSIYAHELAHTMKGPVNHKGETAGLPPIGNSGEAHAGWFQGKIMAMYNKDIQDKPNRDCDKIFTDPCFKELDFTIYHENEAAREKFGKGKDWHKTWYIWQRLDDVYGPTWYPRWKWVQSTRWADEPTRKLTWEEMTEDMSIAIGGDLFPFMRECGISLNRENIGSVEFQGKQIKLKPVKIKLITPGKVRLEEIGDYKKKI